MSKLYKTYQQQTWNNSVENDLYNKVQSYISIKIDSKNNKKHLRYAYN